MTTAITPRVGSAAIAANTARVTTTGAVEATFGGYGGDAWGNTWRGTWGRAWVSVNIGADAIPASPAIDVTPRIGSAPIANNTKRVTLA